jgi:hypothetical protein
MSSTRRLGLFVPDAVLSRGSVVTGLFLLVLAGCDGYLDVENPASLLDEDLERPELLETLARTPEANIAGDLSSLNSRAGLLSDELLHPSTQLENVDAMQGNRLAANSSVENHWRGLSQSRWLSDEVVKRLTAAVSDPTSNVDVARANFFGGLARISMADHFNVIVYDEADTPRGPITVINDAIVRFQAAATGASSGDPNLQAAALGQVARGYRSLYFEEMHLRGNTDLSLFGKAETAALAALAAGADYSVSMVYGAPGGSNGSSQLGGPNGGVNRVDGTVYNFLPDPVTGNWDPRVPHSVGNVAEATEDMGGEFGLTAENLKYPDRESSLPVSRAAEALLIIAESRLLAGDLPGAVTRINEVRAAAAVRVAAAGYAGGESRGWPPAVMTLSALGPFASADAVEIYDQIKHERQAEFWLEMRRWQDMRYYRIVPDRWLAPNVAAGMDLRWPPAPEEVAQNPNLTIAQTLSVFVSN